MDTENKDRDVQLDVIRSTVSNIRTERNIKPTPGAKMEGSCFLYNGGEMANLFWSQLIYTTEGTGEWQSLKGDVKDGVYEYLENNNFFKKDKA